MPIQTRPDTTQSPAPDGSPAARLVIRLLGGFKVRVDGSVIANDAWSRRKARNLVKLLALAPQQQLHRDQVLEALWPEQDPDIAGPNLRVVLHAARRALTIPGASDNRFLHLHDDQLSLDLEGSVWIDAVAFEAQAATALRSRNPDDLAAALDLYGGELLPENRYEDWALGQRERLRDAHLAVLIELAAIHERAQRYPAAIDLLRSAILIEPSREDGHVALMRIYWDLGQRQLALRHYTDLKRVLSTELDVEPAPETQRLYSAILAGEQPRRRTTTVAAHTRDDSPNRKHNLPSAMTSFVGRAQDVDAVGRRLRDARLVTVTGAGGSGKTRLALAVANSVANETGYPDGVWLVELAALTDDALVAKAVAHAVGITEDPRRPLIDALAEALRNRQMLLVLDNCEHLVDPCAHLITTLLRAGSELRILTTSREALSVPGEVVWSLAPLSLPPRDAAGVSQLLSTEAVQLFVERARFRHPPFELTSENAAAVTEICRKVDGLPLAIELAAARVSLLAPREIATRLDDSLSLLVGGTRGTTPRHQSLRGVLDWSYQLLNEAERALLTALAVFSSGWTLDAAEAVTTSPEAPAPFPSGGHVLDILSHLVDKSLVVVMDAGSGGATRYSLLEPVRQYASERLRERGEVEQFRERHAHHYLALAETAHPQQIGSQQAEWLDRLEREHDNLRTALGWAIEHGQVEIEARMCALLWRFWYFHGHLVEGERWLAGAIERTGDDAVGPLLRGQLLQGAGAAAWNRGDLALTARLNREALALLREAGDHHRAAAVLHNLGLVAEGQVDYAEAERRYGESLRLREELGDTWGVATTLQALGNIAREQGDLTSASARYERSLALQREIGNMRGIALAMLDLGVVALDRGDYVQSQARAAESLELFRALGDKALAAVALVTLGYLAMHQGDVRRAAAAQVESLRLARDTGHQRAVAYGLEGVAAALALRGSDVRAAEQAVRLYGAADGLRARIGLPLPPADYALNTRSLDAARASVGAEAFAAAWSNGATLTLDEAIGIALTEGAAAAQNAPAMTNDLTARLSPRECEVARLAAGGMTNQQIAGQLGMSVRTAETHLSNLLRKLGLTSRRELEARFTSSRAGDEPPHPPTGT